MHIYYIAHHIIQYVAFSRENLRHWSTEICPAAVFVLAVFLNVLHAFHLEMERRDGEGWIEP